MSAGHRWFREMQRNNAAENEDIGHWFQLQLTKLLWITSKFNHFFSVIHYCVQGGNDMTICCIFSIHSGDFNIRRFNFFMF